MEVHREAGIMSYDLEGRWYIVVIREEDGALSGLSRRHPDPVTGEPFAGPWGALSEEEAEKLADAWNADPREGGPAEVVQLYRYDKDPGWPEEQA
jgi:hypothetical protein